MRDIKFRVWDNELKIWAGDVVAGTLLNDLHNDGISVEDKLRFTLFQSTEQVDRDGREIFEGDILSNPFFERCTVKYNAESAAYKVFFKDGNSFALSKLVNLGKDLISIVGNVCKNIKNEKDN